MFLLALQDRWFERPIPDSFDTVDSTVALIERSQLISNWLDLENDPAALLDESAYEIQNLARSSLETQVTHSETQAFNEENFQEAESINANEPQRSEESLTVEKQFVHQLINNAKESLTIAKKTNNPLLVEQAKKSYHKLRELVEQSYDILC